MPIGRWEVSPMYLSIGQASRALGTSVSTLRRWEQEGTMAAAYRKPGGHRRYSLRVLQDSLGLIADVSSRITVAYARVSSSDQKEDLARQRQRLDDYCSREAENYEVIDDLGSGLNYKKRGLKKLIHLILGGRVDRLMLTHKDRLLRFGAEIIFYLCSYCGTKFVWQACA
ncbi:MAG: IS607 family transposase [Deltaproteobacteria bacterium]|nr:IS607 family transposase [Deltaproteobacteria bacterium]